jgi:hypothetical protein
MSGCELVLDVLCRGSRIGELISAFGRRPHDICVAHCLQWMKHVGNQRPNVARSEDSPSTPNSSEAQQLCDPTLRHLVSARVMRKRHSQTRRPQEHPIVSNSPRSVGADEHMLSTSSSTESTTNTELADHPEARAAHSGLTSDTLKLWAKHILRCGFEKTFGVLLGRYGCPFVYVQP